MPVHLIRFGDKIELSEAVAKAGCDMKSLPYFENRREMLQLCVTDVPAPAASIIKQEMLARGGDAAVHAQVITCGVSKSDVIIFGTAKQLGHLAEKLVRMPWWGLERLADDIRALIAPKGPCPMKLPCGAELAFGEGMLLMGIINLTDDSFFAGSRSGAETEETVKRALRMASEGADILDLGAESTRPGAGRVPEEQEISRMESAVRAIRRELPLMPLSIDTTRSSVARAALDAGADIINDVSGLQFDEKIAQAAAEYGAALVVMHMRGTPGDMQTKCEYGDLISEVCSFLREAAGKAERLGVPRKNIIIDPGVGFAKDYNQNLLLMRHCESFKALGYPLLVGASRKGVVGTATRTKRAEDRLCGTLALTSVCCWQGADIIRVHDVKENKEVIMMTEAVRRAKYV